jgi:outer membrane receptor protein involved in Fe transport
MRHLRIAPCVPALLLAASPLPLALAAEPADTVLEEVIVTGTLREQALEEVPASVTVLDARTLQEAGQQHLQDVLGLVPNLNWAAGTSRPRYFQIRGVGEREQYEGAPNPSVGFLIDDIDFSGLGMPATLFDVEQIEVLRGPQGTRYGANALAGLMVVRGKAPQRAAGYALEATGAEYGTWSLGAAATGPVDALDSAWRLSVQKYESDGFMRNQALGRSDTNGRDELTARAKWRSWIGGAGTLDVTLLHADIDNGYDAWTFDGSRDTQTNQPGVDRQRTNAASVRFETGLGGNTVTAIASHARSKTSYGYDYDWGNTQFWDPYFYEGAERWDRVRRTGSAELRLASPQADETPGLAWLAGAYVLRLEEDGRYASAGEYVDPVDADWNWTDARLIDDRYRATSVAIFGQLDGGFTHSWRWSAGVRVEQRRARFSDAGVVNAEPYAPPPLAARDRMLGGQVSLSHDIGEAMTGYALVSRGYKAGGFNLGSVSDALRYFDPEFLWNLETGLKARLAEGRGQADIAVFAQRRRDQQVRSGYQLVGGGPFEFITTNLSGSGAGVEASLAWQLLPQLRVGASVGLLRTRTAATVNEDGESVAPRENAHSPQYTAAVNATWRHPAGFFARLDVTAMDDFYFDVPTDHDQRSRAYMLTHLKAGFERGRWRIEGWLRNVFDERYAVRGFYFGNDPRGVWEDALYRQWGDPRQLGVTVSVDF